MANPLNNEEELFRKIREEKITIDRKIWDILYNRVGDAISAINLLCSYYLTINEPLPPKKARKILKHANVIKKVIHGIFTTKRKVSLFPELREDIKLHPIIIEIVSHHINNDTNAIMIISSFYTDKDFFKPIPIEDIKKILDRTKAIKDLLERLKEATGLV